MRAWDLAINALGPYDDFAWNKYLETIYKLDSYNWAECGEIEGLGDVLNQEAERHAAFFGQDNFKEIIEANTVKYADDLDATILVLQDGWYNADAPMAGMAYAHFWRMLFDEHDK